MASSGGRSSIQWNRATVAVLLGAGGLLAAALAYIGIADPHRPGFVGRQAWEGASGQSP